MNRSEESGIFRSPNISGVREETMHTYNEDYFYCYDRLLFDYLSNAGFRFITKARNIKDNRVFSLFERTNDLDYHLSKWMELKT